MGARPGRIAAAGEWDAEELRSPPLDTMAGALRELARRLPDKVAVDADDTVLTYAELARRANDVAIAVLDRVPSPDTPVALVLGHGAAPVSAVLGVFSTDRIGVPLDGREPVERLSAMLGASRAGLIVTDRRHQDHAQAAAPGVELLVLEDVARSDRDCPIPVLDAELPGYILFTSGSSGTPKGVVFSHKWTVLNALHWGAREGMSPADRVTQFNPVSFVGGLSRVIATTVHGATAFMYDLKARGARDLPDWMRAKAITVATGSPSTFRALGDVMGDRDPITTVRRVCLGGETVYGADVYLARRLFGPDVIVENMFGSSEAGGIALHEVGPGDDPDDGPLPAGRIVADVDVRLLDDDDQPVPPGVPGRIVTVKEATALGYWDDPELTAEVFFTTPDGRRGARTSDLALLRADGLVIPMGRLDTRVKVRGAMVATSEVERALTTLDSVTEAAVVAVPVDDDSNRLVAYVTSRGATAPSPAQVRRDVALIVPSTMVPATVVVLDELPYNARGKIDRAALPPPPTVPPYREPHGYAAALAALFGEVLGLDQVGLDDDFFELGGDSLGALDLVAAIGDRFGVEMATTTLLDAPTPGALASRLGGRRSSDASVVVPLAPDGEGAPFFCVAGAGAPALSLRTLAAALDGPCYGIQARGLEERALPDRTTAMIAKRNVTALQREVPAGPVVLGGYSFGGQIAFAMALRMEAAGRAPALLVLLDAPCPGQIPKAPARVAARVSREWSSEPQSTARDRAVRIARDAARGARAYATRQVALATAGIVPRRGLAQYELFLELHTQTGLRYRPSRPFSGAALLVRVGEPSPADPRPRDFGWSRWIRGPITVVDVPGDHLSLLRQPAVTAVAEHIRAALAASPLSSIRQ